LVGIGESLERLEDAKSVRFNEKLASRSTASDKEGSIWIWRESDCRDLRLMAVVDDRN